jgi:adenylate cyclase class 1
MKPDSGVVRDVLLANRKHFVTYNITRLRELLRYLPAKKLDLFYTIPLLLHVNSPDYPGYVDNPRIPHGIYGFYDSGFWRLAKKRLNIEMKDVRPFVSKSFCIKGIYLIGSAGSLGQTERSDFDYWVVVDKDAITDNQRGLLKKKLRMIEKWADETYGHHLTFFLLDSEQVRQNDFSGFDEEGLRTAQRTLLKEEFYRTFILIGGQIPYWAVLPVGLEDFQYREWVAAASCGGEGFFPDDYIDLGNLTCIKREECYAVPTRARGALRHYKKKNTGKSIG